MSIALVIAIITLIAKLPDIIHLIQEIIAKIRNKPVGKRKALFGELHDIVHRANENHGLQGVDSSAELKAFAAKL